MKLTGNKKLSAMKVFFLVTVFSVASLPAQNVASAKKNSQYRF